MSAMEGTAANTAPRLLRSKEADGRSASFGGFGLMQIKLFEFWPLDSCSVRTSGSVGAGIPPLDSTLYSGTLNVSSMSPHRGVLRGIEGWWDRLSHSIREDTCIVTRAPCGSRPSSL